MAGAAQPDGLDKQKMKQILVPALAVGAIIVLVSLVIYVSDTATVKKMSDGSDGSPDDPGLKELAPGVRYRDIKTGVGEECPAGAEVKIHYTGWLVDGTKFDSSKDRGQPAQFQLEGLIKGWQEGIPGMKPGGIRKLVIAPEKGYGERGSPPKIPANSTLIFEVELIEATPLKPRAMSDGSNGGVDDPNLKDVGDGLKIRDLKEGTGDPVAPGATVTIYYTGWLKNGKQFDSNKGKGPNTWPLTSLVQGWQKGIPGMKPGGIRKLVVPAELGYGERGSPPDIPGGATLIFEVELVK
ncbi:FKBP-type peptidyl-prolyl cis-trans isomerase [Gemmata sp. JC717]|uniref:Peptidyl-prolyl cis-trans isomerase n=1 Tax=Gemmata algarum TaxID=2975278 RepID=A0ABU5EVT9_9BACT|nr:FKBP-type peptidyl-prolyl cis-trans isomerase [Gemmata algarum]MDY3556120.1 FKBP-type peptidyl-prolyl cis-trans isomerase [Gemmata algarum]MDY3559416.1 FKBP-type peptidyl-prolyl cis-trans isomerase [Gemmata algarum]